MSLLAATACAVGSERKVFIVLVVKKGAHAVHLHICDMFVQSPEPILQITVKTPRSGTLHTQILSVVLS